MSRRYWTNHERRRALELREEGLSYDKISVFVPRSADAIAAHLRAFRIANSPERNGPRSDVGEAGACTHSRR